MIRFFFYFNFINLRNGNYKKVYKLITQDNTNFQSKYPKFLPKDQHKLKLPIHPYSI
jgi:hypothetical protein